MFKVKVYAILSIIITLMSGISSNEFVNKVVLVTGGTTGIGYSTALSFAKEGAKVIIIGRNSRPECFTGESSEKKINEDSDVKVAGGSAKFMKADIRKLYDVRKVIDTIERVYGGLDIAVNNAGIAGFIGNIEDIPDDHILSNNDPILNNVYGTYNSLHEEIKYFKKVGKSGVIVNLTSYNGIRACATCSLYSASKFAIIGLTKSVALENIKEPYIRVNAIAPGFVDTYLTRNQVNFIENKQQAWEGTCVNQSDPIWIRHKDEFAGMTLKGVLIDPQEIADMVLYLASKKSNAITGSVLPGEFGQLSQ